MRSVRLGALLHDIGHITAGHTLEDELGLLDVHDAGVRLAQSWDRPAWNGVPVAKTLRQVLDETSSHQGLREFHWIANQGLGSGTVAGGSRGLG
jgi:HD superfamily phosphohydrolase